MRELYEFRILEKNAHLIFEQSEGKKLGDSVRKVVVDGRDPRFQRIGEIDRTLKLKTGNPFYYLHCARSYSQCELREAKLFRLLIKPSAVFEPDGESCGTEYDNFGACSICGAGCPANISTNIRDGSDFALTKEYVGRRRGAIRPNQLIIVSAKVRSILISMKARGVDFEIVHLI